MIFLPECLSLTSVQTTFVKGIEIFNRKFIAKKCNALLLRKSAKWFAKLDHNLELFPKNRLEEKASSLKERHLKKSQTCGNSLSDPDLRLATSPLSISNCLVWIPLFLDCMSCTHQLRATIPADQTEGKEGIKAEAPEALQQDARSRMLFRSWIAVVVCRHASDTHQRSSRLALDLLT